MSTVLDGINAVRNVRDMLETQIANGMTAEWLASLSGEEVLELRRFMRLAVETGYLVDSTLCQNGC